MQSLDSSFNFSITKRYPISLLLSGLISVIYYLVLENTLSLVDFSIFYYRSTEFASIFSAIILSSSLGLCFILVALFTKIQVVSSRRKIAQQVTILVLSWFFSFTVFYSYAPDLLLNSPQIINLHVAIQSLLFRFVSPITGILFAVMLLGYWHYQIFVEESQLSTETKRETVLLAMLMFPVAAFLGFLLMVFTDIILPSFGEGSVFANVIISGLLSIYILTRFGLLRLNPELRENKPETLFFETESIYGKSIQLIVELIILLLVLIPAFALSGLYVSDAPEFYNPDNFNFQLAFIQLTLLLPLPLALFFATRFQK